MNMPPPNKQERTAPRPSHLPLQGVRIISLEQFGAAPYGTMFLAHMGAEVIKIENPSIKGDPARHTGPFFLGANDSQYFQGWNTNKLSVELDLKSSSGRAAFDALVRDADVVLNNLRGDQPAKLGLDYQALSELNPAVVCVHISAYGRHNSRATWPGYDYLMQAESGMMHLTGDPESAPTRVGAPSIVDHMTGITSIVGLLAALLRARETGQGCDVDTNLFDVALHQLGYAATWFLNEGHSPEKQQRSGHYSLAPVQTFPTQDGWLFIMCMTQKFWEALLIAMGRQDLGNQPEFLTASARHEHRSLLTELLDAEFKQQPTSYWLQKLEGILPIAPVLSLKDALQSDFFHESGMLSTVDHTARAPLHLLSNPLQFDGRRPTLRACSALGTNTDTVLPSFARKDTEVPT